jgi:1-acyl-sn-glycerol-3-phosphate acyltransferase
MQDIKQSTNNWTLNLIARSVLFHILAYTWITCSVIFFTPLFILPVKHLSKLPKLWAGAVLWLAEKILGITYIIKGVENLKNKNEIISSKHQSAWEIFFFCFILEAPAAVLKEELLRIPLFNLFLKKFKMIPVRRNNKNKGANDFITKSQIALKEGRQILIFPEGTRVAPGAESKIYSGIFRMYSALNVDVVPVRLNSGEFWPRRSYIKTPGEIVVEFMPAIKPGMNRTDFMLMLNDKMGIRQKEIH